VSAYPLDVTDEVSFTNFLDEVERDLGPLDVLINNAGIMPTGAFLDETAAWTGRQIAINIGGVVNGCRTVLPRFLERGHGHVINTSSVAGRTGYAGIATYSGTKFYVYGFSEGLRAELAGTGVELTVVLPGFVNTELTAGIGSARLFKLIDPEAVAAGVLSAIERPRFEVYVPRALGPMTVITTLLPRSVRDAMLRFARADKLALEADPAQRAEYEQRIVRADHPSEATTEVGA
jgi:short-subunit dehydrogenase